jgi:hypothetical protein
MEYLITQAEKVGLFVRLPSRSALIEIEKNFSSLGFYESLPQLKAALFESRKGGPMNVKTKVRAGRLDGNHNTTVVNVKTKVRAGRLASNHNSTVR